MTTRDDLLATIAREEALIARLEREREEAQARIRSLQSELGAPTGNAVSPAVPTAAGDKVALFRSLFRGRDEMFPKLWINPRTNRRRGTPAPGDRAVPWRGFRRRPTRH